MGAIYAHPPPPAIKSAGTKNWPKARAFETLIEFSYACFLKKFWHFHELVKNKACLDGANWRDPYIIVV